MRNRVRSRETAAVVFAVVAVLEAFAAEGAVRIPKALVGQRHDALHLPGNALRPKRCDRYRELCDR